MSSRFESSASMLMTQAAFCAPDRTLFPNHTQRMAFKVGRQSSQELLYENGHCFLIAPRLGRAFKLPTE